MRNVGRKLAFVLASSNHGTMIVNRLDYRMSGPDRGIGVGYQILEAATFDPVEVELALQLIEARKRVHGDGVVAIDGGANIGVHTVEWATAMTGWGSVIGIEAQERIYYALAGNIAINNCFNAIAMHAAISSEQGIMLIPTPDYLVPSSFGSLELKPRAETEFIGQPIDYSAGNTVRDPEDVDRCTQSAPRGFYQARHRGNGARGAGRRAPDDRAQPSNFSG